MAAPSPILLESLADDQQTFQAILSDEELTSLFDKYGVADERQRKVRVRWFFWLMVFSAAEPARRGSLLQLIDFFVGAVHLLFPERYLTSLSKNALSKRLAGINWYLFRGVYNHLLARYQRLLGAQQMQDLGQFKDAFAIDGSVIAVSQHLERVFESVHRGKASLKLNTKYSLKVAAVTKLQVSSGKRHDSRFASVTQAANCLYVVDSGYWSYRLMQKIIDADSSFVMRLTRGCDPLVVAVNNPAWQALIDVRLSELGDFPANQVAHGQIDLQVQLSKAKRPHFRADLRLIGLLHEKRWHFYLTNIFAARVTPQMIYQVYAQRWQVEIFFNLIKNVLNLQHIICRTKNGILIGMYTALIFYLLTRIVVVRAAQQTGRSIHAFSFERPQKLIRRFLLSHFHLFLHESLQAVDSFLQRLVDIVAKTALPSTAPNRLLIDAPFP